MFPITPNSRTKKAFSLLEVLVVLVIISILAILGVQQISKMKTRAESTKCLQNLRALGNALQLYLAEHNQIMPELEAGRLDITEDVPTLDQAFLSYVDSPLVFVCPSDATLAVRSGTSYYWNSTLNNQSTASLSMLGMIEGHIRIPVISDKEGWHKWNPDRINILYADGSAREGIQFVSSDQ